MKPLLRVPVTDVAGLRSRLDAALAGGPAVWPVPAPGGTGGEPGEAARPFPFDPRATGESGALGANGNTRAVWQVGQVDDGIAVVVETSGSTAAPKRVLLSAAALHASAEATATALG
ncbi:MAG TPA: hypothetical protein VFS72_11975, partial [Agromyces sp.]|nr:hypothetical protein [Agromyces sp.]